MRRSRGPAPGSQIEHQLFRLGAGAADHHALALGPPVWGQHAVAMIGNTGEGADFACSANTFSIGEGPQQYTCARRALQPSGGHRSQFAQLLSQFSLDGKENPSLCFANEIGAESA